MRELHFCLKWIFSLWGCLVESNCLERTPLRSSLAIMKPSALLNLTLRLCGRRWQSQQVCRDALKIIRKCRNFPPALGLTWRPAARGSASRCQSQRDWKEHPQGCGFKVADSRETEAGLRLGNGTPGLIITVWTTAPNQTPGIPASVLLGDPV